ncbi:MAG: hypothetical protein M3017_14270 [Actinomycetota bacterium]|nr:hypothetical protein [Actinomycetota bacterium]
MTTTASLIPAASVCACCAPAPAPEPDTGSSCGLACVTAGSCRCETEAGDHETLPTNKD